MLKIAAFAMLAGVILLLAIYRTPDSDAAAMKAKYADGTSRFIDLGEGLVVHARDTGPRDGPVLVLLHGSNASLHSWSPWAAALDGRFRIIRIDLPGHGLTGQHPERDYSTTAYVDVVRRVLDKLAVGRAAMAGSSMGGGVAWRYTLAYPGQVSALILVDSVGQPDPDNPSAPLLFRVARLPGLRQLATHYTPRSWISQSLPSAFGNPALADEAAIDRYWELLRYPGNRLATIDRFATADPPATAADLAAIAVPTLILWGSEDRLIPVSSGRWLQRHIRGSRLIVYRGIGHLPMEEAPAATARDVARFLNGAVEAGPGG